MTSLRPVASSATPAPLASAAEGVRSICARKRRASGSPACQVPLGSMTHTCHSFRASVSCRSPTRSLCARRSTSSRSRDASRSCQYSCCTPSSPRARSVHCFRSWCRSCASTAPRASSAIGSAAPSSSCSPFCSARSLEQPCSRSSSASAPQASCCTDSQAPRRLTTRPSLREETSLRARATSEAQLSGRPPADLGFARHSARSLALSSSRLCRNSGLSCS
mmetsp:Transcript_54324/g.144253  ORF Transcript_54324/g.144253 Transcript_54324/m.144253 type:complete len:221 (+) Transcript_54324:543-1205(+)